MKTKTNGAFGVRHSVYGDVDSTKTNFVAEGSLTKGKGTPEHPSTNIAPNDLRGRPNPQNAIPFDAPVDIPIANVSPEIQGSSQYFNQQSVQEKVDDLHNK